MSSDTVMMFIDQGFLSTSDISRDLEIVGPGNSQSYTLEDNGNSNYCIKDSDGNYLSYNKDMIEQLKNPRLPLSFSSKSEKGFEPLKFNIKKDSGCNTYHGYPSNKELTLKIMAFSDNSQRLGIISKQQKKATPAIRFVKSKSIKRYQLQVQSSGDMIYDNTVELCTQHPPLELVTFHVGNGKCIGWNINGKKIIAYLKSTKNNLKGVIYSTYSKEYSKLQKYSRKKKNETSQKIEDRLLGNSSSSNVPSLNVSHNCLGNWQHGKSVKLVEKSDSH